LYIYDKWNWKETYTIINIDFSKDILKEKDYKRRVILELEKNYINNELEFKKELEELENLKKRKKSV
jgi:hypothetical protein